MDVSRSSEITLQEITKDTFFGICQLAVSPEQKLCMDTVAESLAEANFYDSAWFRAVYADETPVGFVMLDDQPAAAKYYVWRFMIDARFQGMGFGRKAMELLIEHVRGRPNATELRTSVMQIEGGPQGFYESLGFELTGDYADRSKCLNQNPEAFMRLELKERSE